MPYVDHRDAKTVLERAWIEAATSRTISSPELHSLIERIMAAKDAKGFGYVLVTGILARCVNAEVHPRALQAGSSLPGAYDARSLCHKVIVPFEKTKGNLFGLSNEPFLSKPLRHPEHDGENPQLKNRIVAKDLHKALELVHQADAKDVYTALVDVLRLGKARADATRSASIAGDHTLNLCRDFVRQFLQQADGGARLVGVWGAILSLTNDNAEVCVYNPNQSDKYSGTLGDVEVYQNGIVISASECKHRPLTLEDVEHGLRKNTIGAEYVFVVAAGLDRAHEREIRARLEEAASHIDTSLVDAPVEVPSILKMLGPHRRQKFGPCVVDLLRKMREFDAADAAANLWNSLQSKQVAG